MRIQHNITAMNSYRNFSANNTKLSKNLEKLSSGYKINRAGDDAAGLAISEKMRAQITGIEGATKNSKDGISLIQTAEGALTEVHDMLNRMTTLAEQSANGTYQNELDREQLQKEVTALKDEIDRIADSTNFNGLKLLDGSLAETTDAVNNETQLSTIKATQANSGGAIVANTKFVNATSDSYEVTIASIDANKYGAYKINFSDKNGQDYELTLVGNADNTTAGLDANTGVANSLNGTGTGLTLSVAEGVNQEEALQAFRDSFQVAAGSTNANIKVTVKDNAIGAKLTSVSYAEDTSSAAAVTGLATGQKGITKTAGMDAGYQLNISTAPAAGDTISIGDKTYEFVAAAGDAVSTAGATAVVKGTTANDAMKNLSDRLKEDGYDVTLDQRTAGAGNNEWNIRFTKLDQISEAQSGGAVSVSSSALAVHDQEAAKQKTTVAVSAALDASSTYNMTIGYVDAEGKNQSKTISFATGATAPADAAANSKLISDAIKADGDLSKLFDVDDKGASGVQLTAKSTDNSVGQFSTFAMQKAAAGATPAADVTATTTITAGVNDGKAIELKNPDGAAKNILAGDTVTVNGKTYEFAASGSSKIGDGHVRVLAGKDGLESMKNLSNVLTDNGVLNSYDAATGKVVMRDVDNIMQKTTGGLSLQIGDTADSFNKLTVSVSDMHSKSIGVGDVDISTQEGASEALDKIKQAINNVSDTRGTLGALQNRLEHTINNLGVQRENIQNAESLIRDTDVAEEMMTYTKNNILNQSAQAMLAQANQLPQGVLQLLQ